MACRQGKPNSLLSWFMSLITYHSWNQVSCRVGDSSTPQRIGYTSQLHNRRLPPDDEASSSDLSLTKIDLPQDGSQTTITP